MTAIDDRNPCYYMVLVIQLRVFRLESTVVRATIWAANSCPGGRDDNLLLVYAPVAWEAIETRKISRQLDRPSRGKVLLIRLVSCSRVALSRHPHKPNPAFHCFQRLPSMQAWPSTVLHKASSVYLWQPTENQRKSWRPYNRPTYFSLV